MRRDLLKIWRSALVVNLALKKITVQAAIGVRVFVVFVFARFVFGSVAEWLACWTQAQKGLGSNCSRNAVGKQS